MCQPQFRPGPTETGGDGTWVARSRETGWVPCPKASCGMFKPRIGMRSGEPRPVSRLPNSARFWVMRTVACPVVPVFVPACLRAVQREARTGRPAWAAWVRAISCGPPRCFVGQPRVCLRRDFDAFDAGTRGTYYSPTQPCLFVFGLHRNRRCLLEPRRRTTQMWAGEWCVRDAPYTAVFPCHRAAREIAKAGEPLVLRRSAAGSAWPAGRSSEERP